MNIWYFCLMSL